MIQIKLPNELPPEIEHWKERAREITDLILAEDDLEKRHNLIDKYNSHWRKPELVKWLSDIGHEKCWYTETKFGGDYQEVEHFRPKKGTKERDGSDHPYHLGYYWLSFDLNNYRLCKNRPNRKKSTFFPIFDERNRACCEQDDYRDELPLFLDPIDEEDCLLLTFNEDGAPEPQIGIEERDRDRVEFTIEKYYLDERVLNGRRAEAWAAVRNLFYEYLNKSKEAKAGNKDRVTRRAEAKAALKRIKSLLERNEEFVAVKKASLIKTGDQMAIRIASDI